jgi:hypothetical protein
MISNKEYADYMRTKSEADYGVIRVSTELWKTLADIIGNSVEVVRCSECQHWGGVTFGFICRKFSGVNTKICMHADDYCSYGERRCEK